MAISIPDRRASYTVASRIAASLPDDIAALRRESDQLTVTIESLEHALAVLSPDGDEHSPTTPEEPTTTKEPVARKRVRAGKPGRVAVLGGGSITKGIVQLLGSDPEREWQFAEIVAALKNGGVVSKNIEGSVRNTLARLHRTDKIAIPTRGRYQAIR